MNIARPRIDLARTPFDKTRAFVRFGTRFDPDPDSPEDLYTRAVIEEQGFDGPPDVIAAEELDGAVARGETELFRGIVGDGRATAAEYADRLRYGPFFVGRGRLGGGMYASTSLDEARVFAEDPSGAILRMVLRPEARVGRADEVARMAEREQQEETRRLAAEQARARQAAVERQDYGEARRVQGAYDRMLGAVAAICFDLGRYAAYLGYDALYDEGRGVYLVLGERCLPGAESDRAPRAAGGCEMVNAALSRRLGRVMNMEPLTRLGAVDRLELGRRVDAAGSFEELSPEDRELILAAEEMRERLIAEKRELGEQMAAGRPRRTSARGA